MTELDLVLIVLVLILVILAFDFVFVMGKRGEWLMEDEDESKKEE